MNGIVYYTSYDLLVNPLRPGGLSGTEDLWRPLGLLTPDSNPEGDTNEESPDGSRRRLRIESRDFEGEPRREEGSGVRTTGRTDGTIVQGPIVSSLDPGQMRVRTATPKTGICDLTGHG